LLPRLLVHVGRSKDAVAVDHGGQRDGTCNLGPGFLRGLDDLHGRLVQELMIIGLKPNADFLILYQGPSLTHEKM
jgi:hypothetical protein